MNTEGPETDDEEQDDPEENDREVVFRVTAEVQGPCQVGGLKLQVDHGDGGPQGAPQAADAPEDEGGQERQ